MNPLGREGARRELPGQFAELYRRPAEFMAIAPGRVNVIGEHVDYNGGWVMPAAIDREMFLTFAPRHDAQVNVTDCALRETVGFRINGSLAAGAPRWGDYIFGVTELLRRRFPGIKGFDALLWSSIPRGGGLSSSAALEAVVGLAVLRVNGLSLPAEELARICQCAEHEFAGVPCGILDQMAVLMCRSGELLLLDCESGAASGVPFGSGDWVLMIINSGVAHENASGEYAARRRVCEQAAALLGVTSLSRVTPGKLGAALMRPALTPEMQRLVRHVVTENARTLEVAGALRQGDYWRAGAAMNASHASLRDDYRVSCAELDQIVAVARQLEGVAGCRMTGGGFGGSAVALLRADGAARCARRIDEAFRRQYGRGLDIFVTCAAESAQVVTVMI